MILLKASTNTNEPFKSDTFWSFSNKKGRQLSRHFDLDKNNHVNFKGRATFQQLRPFSIPPRSSPLLNTFTHCPSSTGIIIPNAKYI